MIAIASDFMEICGFGILRDFRACLLSGEKGCEWSLESSFLLKDLFR